MFSRFCSLALAAALVGCAGPVPAGAPDASAPAHVYGAALPFAYPVVPPDGSVGDLCSVDGSTVPRVCSIQGVSVPPGGGGGAAYEAGTNTSQALVWSGSTYAPRQLTTDDLAPAFSIGLSAASGGGSPIQIGATWTPTFNVSYSPNGTGLTAATEADSLGNSLNVLGSSNPLASPATNYTQTSVNATVTVSVTATRSGVTKTSNGVGMQWEPFCWYGVGTAGATGVNGTTGVLAGATGTLSSQLRSGRGGSFSASPSSQKVYFACPASYGAVSFLDQNGFAFSMLSPSTITVVNVSSISLSYSLYESTNLLSTSYTVSES